MTFVQMQYLEGAAGRNDAVNFFVAPSVNHPVVIQVRVSCPPITTPKTTRSRKSKFTKYEPRENKK